MNILRRAPAASAVSIIALGVAIGMVTATFAIVNAVVIRPLPYNASNRLLQLNSFADGANTPANFSLAEYDDLGVSLHNLAALAAFSSDDFSLARDGDAAAPVRGAIVSHTFFPLLATPPQLGRWLASDTGENAEVVISDRLWRDQWSKDPSVLGRSIQLNGRPYAIVGVAAPQFRFPSAETDVWLPLEFLKPSAPPQWSMRGYRSFSVIARLRDDADLSTVGRAVDAAAHEWRRSYARFSANLSGGATLLKDRVIGDTARVLWLLVGSAAIILVIAFANLANLLLARNATRTRDMAVRVALGASRGQIIGLSLRDAFVLCAAGGIAGIACAAMLIQITTSLAPDALPRAAEIRVDPAVVLFVVGAIALSTVTIGLPVGIGAWRSAREVTLGDARTRTDVGATRSHTVLTVGQLALSLALTVNASLLTRSLSALMNTDSGTRDLQVVTMKLNAVDRSFLDRALPRIAALPGIHDAGIISSLPPNVSQMHTTVSSTSPANGQHVDVSVDIVSVSPGALEALGVRVMRGRAFTEGDLTSTIRPILISDMTAQRLFPGVDPIGRTLPFGGSDPIRGLPQVIGVVSSVRYRGLDVPPDGAIYFPYTERPFSVTYLVVRSIDTTHIAQAVRAIVRDVDPRQALSEPRSLESVIRASVTAPRFRTNTISAFAVIALLLSAMGLYAVMSHAVATRTAEIGVRMSLGASSLKIIDDVLRDDARLLAIGLALGAPLSYVGARLVARFLFGIVPADPWSIVFATTVLSVVALLAVLVPALRASSVSPVEAMRRS